ncbi:MAG: GNAT family N-acetyltransferase [Spirochaetales bacterium]
MRVKILRCELKKVAESVISLWNDCMGDSFPLDDRLFRQLALAGEMDEKALFVSRREGQEPISGMALAKLTRGGRQGTARPEAHISFLLVSPREQKKGIGGYLLEAAERWCRENGATSIHLGSDYHHFFPGVPLDDSPRSRSAIAFFSKKKYVNQTIELDLIADLSINSLLSPSDEDDVKLNAAGARFALCAPWMRAAVLDFFARSFPGRWEQEISEAFSSGLRDEDLALLTRKADNTVIGFARLCSSDSPLLSPGLYWRGLLGPNAAALGPIGIDAAYRGAGLGLILLRKSLGTLKARGARNAVIDWTDQERFYARVGFAPWKRYQGMMKNLKA